MFTLTQNFLKEIFLFVGLLGIGFPSFSQNAQRPQDPCPSGQQQIGKFDPSTTVCAGNSKIQVGAFGDFNNAKNFVNKMRSQGFDATLDPGIEGQLNKVLISVNGKTGFSDDSAKTIGSRLAQAGIKYSVVIDRGSSQLATPQAKSQPAPSNLKQSGNRVVGTPETLEQQAFCFGVFNGLKSLNIGFNQSGNNEYFKKYKNEFFKTYTPILDKVEPCVNSNRPVTGNVMLQCGKKTLNNREYQLFIRFTAGYADVVEANQKRDEMKLGSLKFICSVININ